MKRRLLYSAFLFCLSVMFGQGVRISWTAIDEPGELRMPVVTNVPMDESQVARLEEHGAITPSLDALERHDDRLEALARQRHPALIYLTIGLPARDNTFETVAANDDSRNGACYRAGHVYLVAELRFAGGVKPTYAVQFIPLKPATSAISGENTVQDVEAVLDKNYTITATPDRDGKLRFDITDLVPKLRSGELDGRFALKPFKFADSFEMPEVGTTPFRVARAVE